MYQFYKDSLSCDVAQSYIERKGTYKYRGVLRLAKAGSL